MKNLERIATFNNCFSIFLAFSLLAVFWGKGMIGSVTKIQKNVWEEYHSRRCTGTESSQTTCIESKLSFTKNRDSMNVKLSAVLPVSSSSVYNYHNLYTSVNCTTIYSQENVIWPTTTKVCSRLNHFTAYKQNILKVEKKSSRIKLKISNQVFGNKSIHELRIATQFVWPLQKYEFEPDIQTNINKNYLYHRSRNPKIFVQLQKKKKIALTHRMFTSTTRKYNSFRSSVDINDSQRNNSLVYRKHYFTPALDSVCKDFQTTNEFSHNIYKTDSSGSTRSFIVNSVNTFIYQRRAYSHSMYNNKLTPDGLIYIFNNHPSKSQRQIRESPSIKILNYLRAQCFIYQYICAWLCKPIIDTPCLCFYSPPSYFYRSQHCLTEVITPNCPSSATFYSPPCPTSILLPSSCSPFDFPSPPAPYTMPYITFHHTRTFYCPSTQPVYSIPVFHSTFTSTSFRPSRSSPRTYQFCSTKLQTTPKTSTIYQTSKMSAKTIQTTQKQISSSKNTKATLTSKITSKTCKTTVVPSSVQRTQCETSTPAKKTTSTSTRITTTTTRTSTTISSKFTKLTSTSTTSGIPINTTRGTTVTLNIWSFPADVPTAGLLSDITFIFVTVPHQHTPRNTTDYHGGDDPYHGYSFDCMYGLAEC